jgi:RNA polymerase sigma-B factor
LGRELFQEYFNTRNKEVRDQIVDDNLNLVKYIARKFANRGEPLEDIIQVGTMGLMKAIDRYDPHQDIEFATYATPTIVGEIKHFFRDKSHLIKIPRRLHELNSRIKKVIFDITKEEGRSPTIAEISEIVGVSEEEVLESLEAGQAYMTVSLDTPSYVTERTGDTNTSSKSSLMDSVKNHDEEDVAIDRETLRNAISNILNRREQRIIYLRFYDNLSQSEIAQLLNLSQMHVSRLLNHSLEKLRKVIVK